MKSYIIPLICMSIFLNGMEQQQIIRESQEWNAQEYAQGNKTQELAGLIFLQESDINLKNKRVLDIGCGIGNITAKIAETAKRTQGIDASKNMIEYAQQKYNPTRVMILWRKNIKANLEFNKHHPNLVFHLRQTCYLVIAPFPGLIPHYHKNRDQRPILVRQKKDVACPVDYPNRIS